jgi:hypothetical protein
LFHLYSLNSVIIHKASRAQDIPNELFCQLDPDGTPTAERCQKDKNSEGSDFFKTKSSFRISANLTAQHGALSSEPFCERASKMLFSEPMIRRGIGKPPTRQQNQADA